MTRTIKTVGNLSIIETDEGHYVMATDRHGEQWDMETTDTKPLTLQEAEDFLAECIAQGALDYDDE